MEKAYDKYRDIPESQRGVIRMKHRRGFTLMELLVALSIFAVIAICLYSVFSGGVGVWRKQEKIFKYSHSIELALDKMAKELRNAIDYSQPPLHPDSPEEGKKLKFEGDEKNLSFMTVHDNNIMKISYFFVSSPDRKGVLKKKISYQKEGFDEEKHPESVFIEGLDKLYFEYAYQGTDKEEPPEWQKEWGDEAVKEGPKKPVGVRVTLEFKEPDQEKQEILRKTVFIPTGTLGGAQPK